MIAQAPIGPADTPTVGEIDTRLLERLQTIRSRERARQPSVQEQSELFLDVLERLRRRLAEEKAALDARATPRRSHL